MNLKFSSDLGLQFWESSCTWLVVSALISTPMCAYEQAVDQVLRVSLLVSIPVVGCSCFMIAVLCSVTAIHSSGLS